MTIYAERIPHSGALVLSAFISDGGGEYLHRTTFYGYTMKEARQLFRVEINERETK